MRLEDFDYFTIKMIEIEIEQTAKGDAWIFYEVNSHASNSHASYIFAMESHVPTSGRCSCAYAW